MALKKDLELKLELRTLKYAILRRAITGRTDPEGKVFSIEDLRNICTEIEVADKKQLEAIHKKWIGY